MPPDIHESAVRQVNEITARYANLLASGAPKGKKNEEKIKSALSGDVLVRHARDFIGKGRGPLRIKVSKGIGRLDECIFYIYGELLGKPLKVKAGVEEKTVRTSKSGSGKTKAFKWGLAAKSPIPYSSERQKQAGREVGGKTERMVKGDLYKAYLRLGGVLVFHVATEEVGHKMLVPISREPIYMEFISAETDEAEKKMEQERAQASRHIREYAERLRLLAGGDVNATAWPSSE